MSVSINEVRDLLAETRNVLEADGWTQGVYHHEGRHCLIGAMIMARKRLYGFQIRPRYFDICCDAMTMLRSCANVGSIPQWNDAPERTVEDVIQLLKDAEHGLEAREL